VNGSQERANIDASLRPYAAEILRTIFRSLKASCEAHGARAAALIVPLPSQSLLHRQALDEIAQIASECGLPVVSLRGSFDVVGDRRELWVTSFDNHTNAKGHRLLAGKLHDRLLESGIIPPPTPADPSKADAPAEEPPR
jgi:hypothetical protein